MAMELAMKFDGNIRVNAIAPGFFIGNQNRDLLLNPDGTYTERGQKVINNTPMGRFGEAHELVGAIMFLSSEAASFVTGVVLPIDGGFSTFSGV
jgi:NAD(P)-dependent dehydrogenase (short-subunit alcohol dehydrogenase family)